MLKTDTDFFRYINNFKKNENYNTDLIKGDVTLKEPLISFIIPCYKSNPEILKQAIDSALNQFEFKDYELMVINNNPEFNCSTDQLIDTYNDEKIIYYKNTVNLGMFGNWNRGIGLARGKWVALLHDDDIASPYFLKSCLPFLKDKVALIKPDNVVFSNSNELNFEKPNDLKEIKLSLSDFFLGCAVGAPTNIIFNKDVLLELGGFNQDYFPSSDYVFAAQCAASYKTYKIPFVLGGYRVGQNESLNPQTMKLFYLKRFFISSYIMRLYHFPDFLIALFQTAFMPRIISDTNNYYNVTIPFDYHTELKLKPINKITRRVIIKVYGLILKLISLKRRVSLIISKNK